MKQAKRFTIQRGLWYVGGFILIYAPFAVFQRALAALFGFKPRFDIHDICFRMGLSYTISGKGIALWSTTGIAFILILGTALLAGPLFCGKLCAAGGLSEYVSRLVPERFKINWQKWINPVPVRYGMMTGFLLAPFLQLSIICAYCNYTDLQRLVSAGIARDMGIWTSTTILTTFVWLILLGAFTKGGRGYCAYLCPIGAIQSLLHAIGAKFNFTYKLKFASDKCASCGNCAKECPMHALRVSKTENGKKELAYERLVCLTCSQCVHSCPKSALAYSRGIDGWSANKDKPGQKQDHPRPVIAHESEIA